jgi:hypothetical protein
VIYGTYQLPDGSWQSVAAFENADEARESLEFHANGRPWRMAEDHESLRKLVNDYDEI